MNQMTSSTDHVDGSLLGGALDSWDSGDALYPDMRKERWDLLGINLKATFFMGVLPCSPPVLLLSENVFGLVDDCRHMVMEAELLENCCDERNPYEDFGE